MRVFKLGCDAQEKRPPPFPEFFNRSGELLRVEVVKVALTTGDYVALSDGYVSAGIERKSDPSELYACFCGYGRQRTMNQLQRMRDTFAIPYLLVDSTPAQVLAYSYRTINPNLSGDTGECVLQQITDACARYRLSLIWSPRTDKGPGAYALGRLILALLSMPRSIEIMTRNS